jgi:hypothetical protein
VTGKEVIGYERTTSSKKLVVLLSFSQEKVSLPSDKYAGWKALIGNIDGFAVKGSTVELRPYEAVVLCEES